MHADEDIYENYNNLLLKCIRIPYTCMQFLRNTLWCYERFSGTVMINVHSDSNYICYVSMKQQSIVTFVQPPKFETSYIVYL